MGNRRTDGAWEGGQEDISAWESAVHAREVRSALQRVDAPDGFTERLMARAELRTRAEGTSPVARRGLRSVLLQFTAPAWRVAYAAAAMLVIGAGTLHVQHVRTEQRRADEAAAQLNEAMAITVHALDHVSVKLQTTEVGELQRVLESKRESQ